MYIRIGLVILVAIPLMLTGCQGGEEQAATAPVESAPAEVVIAKLENAEVEAGCAYCSYKMEGAKGCSLAIKFEDTPYKVTGSDLSAHGEGLCVAVRQAAVTGELLEGGVFKAKSIELSAKASEATEPGAAQ